MGISSAQFKCLHASRTFQKLKGHKAHTTPHHTTFAHATRSQTPPKLCPLQNGVQWNDLSRLSSRQSYLGTYPWTHSPPKQSGFKCCVCKIFNPTFLFIRQQNMQNLSDDFCTFCLLFSRKYASLLFLINGGKLNYLDRILWPSLQIYWAIEL